MLNEIILSSKITVVSNQKIYIYDGVNDCIYAWNRALQKWLPPLPLNSYPNPLTHPTDNAKLELALHAIIKELQTDAAK